LLIEIEDELYNKMLKIVKGRNEAIYNKIKDIKEVTNLNPIDTLSDARAIKTLRVKHNIESTLKQLIDEDIKPTKYQVHKRTNMAYVTLSKYYDEVLKEVTSER